MTHYILVTVETDSSDAHAIRQEIQSNLEYDDTYGINNVVVASVPAELVERLGQ
jgi:hypothetical protein